LDAHSYGHCWRCKNPIIYRATRQWFIDIGKIKTEMIAEVDRVRWTPEWAGSARERDWVVNARDWCISRQRYWGIPVPVWRCSNAHIRVVGSAAELEHDGLNYEAGMDLHRPWIDGVVMPCKQCGGDMRRVPDVLDVWFDSAVASWAELRFPSHSRDFEKWFPCDFIVEGLDQTRGWFYSQLAAGVAAMGRVPYESVVMHGWVNDEQGRPMSKSLGNYIPPHELIVKHGADAVRFELLRAGAPWDDLSIGWEAIRNRSRVLNVLWNVHVFATTYMALDAFVPPSGAAASRPRAATSLRVEDRWMRSRVASVIARATAALESHEVQVAAREVERLILEDLSRWYVRLVRDRVWSEGHQADKVAAYETLHHALLSLAKLLAPMAPYLAEALFQDLVPTGATVHGERWPEAQAADLDVELEESMATVRAIVEASANARQNAGMKLRWPVARVVVAGGKDVERAIEGNRGLLEEMTNAKRIDFVGEAWAGLEVAAQPVKNRIGPAFKGRAGEAIAALQRADGRAVRKAIQSGGWEAAPGIVLGADMVTFETRLPPHVTGSEFQGGAIYIDTDVTPELKGEGYARDLSRRIQELRKRLALPLEQRIAVDVLAPPDFQALVAPHAGNVAQATRATAVQFVQEPAGAVVETWDIEGEAITIGVRPLGGEFPAARGPAQASTNRAPGRSRKVAVKRAPRPRGATTPRKTARTRAARARGKTTTGRNRPIRSQTGGVSPSRAGKAEGKRARTGRPRGRKGRSSGASKPASRAAGRPPRKGQAKGPPRSKKGRGRSR
jgi:isoleucyl-tRNA synthetase